MFLVFGEEGVEGVSFMVPRTSVHVLEPQCFGHGPPTKQNSCPARAVAFDVLKAHSS